MNKTPAMSTPLRKLAERFSETAIDDEIVVMQLDTGVFFSLSGTGRAIWLLLDGTRDRAALLTALAESYDRTADELAPEVDAFITQLIEAGLIEAIN